MPCPYNYNPLRFVMTTLRLLPLSLTEWLAAPSPLAITFRLSVAQISCLHPNLSAPTPVQRMQNFDGRPEARAALTPVPRARILLQKLYFVRRRSEPWIPHRL